MIERSSINKNYIRNILTIRYNPTEKSPISRATDRNFISKKKDDNGKITEDLLKKSITKKIPNNDDPIIVSLSSGIDSSLTLGLLRNVFPKRKIIAICGVFEDSFDESKRAELIANKFDSDFKAIPMDSVFKSISELINITKKPRWNTYQHLIAREGKKHGKIFVTGDGADEIFGGYNFRYHKFLNLLKPKDGWKDKVVAYLECHNRDFAPDQDKLFGKAINFDWNDIYNYFKKYFLNTLYPLQQVMLSDFNGKLLFDFIPTAKSIYNHYKLKGAPIFLDQDVISFGLQLPTEQKYNPINQFGKITLRKIAKRHGINHIDEKRGFSPSLLFDWKTHGSKICPSYLNKDSYLVRKQLINFSWLSKALEKVENDGDVRYLNRIISILTLEIWCRIFITKELKSPSRLN